MNALGSLGSAVGGFIGSQFAPNPQSGAGIGNTAATTPGYQLHTYAGGSTELNRNPSVQTLYDQFASINPQLDQIRAQVTPGFGRLTNALVTGIRNAAAESIGNLRQQFANRRVQGASFAEDAIGRQELAFGQAESTVRAQGFLQELQLNVDLINQQTNNIMNQLKANMDELQLSAGQQKSALDIVARAAAVDKQLTVQAASNIGQFGAQLGGSIGRSFGGQSLGQNINWNPYQAPGSAGSVSIG